MFITVEGLKIFPLKRERADVFAKTHFSKSEAKVGILHDTTDKTTFGYIVYTSNFIYDAKGCITRKHHSFEKIMSSIKNPDKLTSASRSISQLGH